MFYKIDSTRITLREYGWAHRSSVVLLAALLKLFRIRLDSSADDPNVASLQPFEQPESALPAVVRTAWASLLGDLRAQGFEDPVFHAIADAHHLTQIYLVTLRHASGRAFARIQYRLWQKPHPPKTFLFPCLITVFADHTMLVTTAAKPDLAGPGVCRINRKMGASVSDLWASHQSLLDREWAGKVVVPTRNRQELEQASESHHAVIRDFHLRRGVFVPMSDAERAQAQAMEAHMKSAQADGLPHAEVLAELRHAERSQPGWGTALVIFAVSLVLFLGAASARWALDTVLLLIVVLFLHECGHYVAMRGFKYRNVRMFFIPFFGAAVSGRNYNVPGWKKVVVSLMGPVPGIFLGLAVGGASLGLHQPEWLKLAVMLLILNAVNMLPMLPLDGGWIMHTLVFSRHGLWDTLFRLAAALALIGGGVYVQDWIFSLIGMCMLIGLPTAGRLAHMAVQLRNRGLAAGSPDDESIPTETALAIIDEIKRVFPRGLTSKSIAQHTLHVYETLNSHPPGLPASVGFFLAYVLSGLLAFLSAGFFIFHQSSQRAIHLSALYTEPEYILRPETHLSWRGGIIATQGSALDSTLLATFARPANGLRMFYDFTNRLPATARMEWFGQTLCLRLAGADDAARRPWQDQLRAWSKEVILDDPNSPAELFLTCQARNEVMGQAVYEEINEYLVLPTNLCLFPPWIPHDTRSPQERARHRLARQTYIQLQEAGLQGYEDPTVRELQKTIIALHLHGDSAAAAKLEKELGQRVRQIGRRHQTQVSERGPDKVDRELIALYQARPVEDFTTNWMAYACQKLAPLMGQLQHLEGQAAPEAERYSIRWGQVARDGTTLCLPWLAFRQVIDGAPALIQWLREKGCDDFRYAFRSPDVR
jgi:Zn-dependent protease